MLKIKMLKQYLFRFSDVKLGVINKLILGIVATKFFNFFQ